MSLKDYDKGALAIIITDLLLIFIISLGAGILVKRLGVNSLVGFLIGGIFSQYLYTYFLGVDPRYLLRDPIVQTLAYIGLVLLGLDIGSEFSIETLRKTLSKVVILEFFSLSIIWVILRVLSEILALDPITIAVLFLITINTSTGILYKHLNKLIMIERSEYELILAATAMEDLLALLGLSVLLSYLLGGYLVFNMILVGVGGLLIFLSSSLLIGHMIFKRIIRAIKGDIELLGLLCVALAMIYSYLSNLVGLSPFIGAFAAGVVIGSSVDPKSMKYYFTIMRELGLLFYFSSIGLLISDLPRVSITIISLWIFIGFLVMVIKYIGFSVASWLIGIDLRSAFRYGVYMTSISEFGLIIANELYRNNLVNESLVALASIIFIISSTLSSILVRKDIWISNKIYEIIPKWIKGVYTQRIIMRTIEKSIWLNIVEYMFAILIYISLIEYISYMINKVIPYGEYSVLILSLLLIAFSLWIFLIVLDRYIVKNVVNSLVRGYKVRVFGKGVSVYITLFTILPIMFVVILYQLRISFLLDIVLRSVFTGVNDVLITILVIFALVVLPTLLIIYYTMKKIIGSLKKNLY
ncbi:MAG: cation:proton antiporter [Sulfolobales archaeon]